MNRNPYPSFHSIDFHLLLLDPVYSMNSSNCFEMVVYDFTLIGTSTL